MFVGSWVPDARDAQIRPLYCALMLMLLSPWRVLKDLKKGHHSFEAAFSIFCRDADEDTLSIVRHIQNFYVFPPAIGSHIESGWRTWRDRE